MKTVAASAAPTLTKDALASGALRGLDERLAQEDRLRAAGIGVDGGGQSMAEGAPWDIFLDPPFTSAELHSVADVDAFMTPTPAVRALRDAVAGGATVYSLVHDQGSFDLAVAAGLAHPDDAADYFDVYGLDKNPAFQASAQAVVDAARAKVAADPVLTALVETAQAQSNAQAAAEAQTRASKVQKRGQIREGGRAFRAGQRPVRKPLDF